MKVRFLSLAGLALHCAALAQPPSTYDQAVTARRAGENEQARGLLDQVVAAEPGNADAWLQFGLALLGLGRLDEAERAFQRTLAIAPDYPDARIGLARIAQRRGDRRGALEVLEPVSPTNAEAGALRADLQAIATDTPTQLDLELSYSDLEENRPDWKEGSIRLQHQISPATAVGAGLEVSSRFGVTDVYGELRLDNRLSEAASLYATLGGTPGADFRPEWQIGLGGSVRAIAGVNPTVLTFDVRQAHFASGDIQTVNPGMEQYLAGGRAWLTARWINVLDENGGHESGWLLRGHLQASERTRLFLGAADAPDTSEGVVTDTMSLFGGVTHELSDRQTLRLSVAHENREGSGDRLQLGIGLGTRF